MNQNEILNMSSQDQQSAFVARCTSDVQFAINSIAAVLSNDETKSAFMAGVSSIASTASIPGGVQMESPYKISYNLAPIEQRLNISVSGNPTPTPLGHLNLLSYNGSEWGGLLPQAAKVYKVLPLGILISALTQALFGTKAGPAVLVILLAL